jgi:regulator of cell morphogenesis and NO signaling
MNALTTISTAELLQDKLTFVRRSRTNHELNSHLIEILVEASDDHAEFPLEALRDFSIQDLVAFLRLSHDYYLNRKLPSIEQSIYNLFREDAQADPLMRFLCAFFVDYSRVLKEHIRLEERKLFPYIEVLVSGKLANQSDLYSGFSTQVFLDSHTDVEVELNRVRQVIAASLKDKEIPMPFRVFIHQLEQFEADLWKHAMIEDEVLLPKVQAYERGLGIL